jgi:DNA-binding protein YbaB
MKNLGNMMKQVQEMQSKMADMQARLDELTVTGQAGQGWSR